MRALGPLFKSLERSEFDHVLLTSKLRGMGYLAPTKKIHDLRKAGVIIGVKKGLYVLSEDYAREPVVKETLANLIYGPSYVSLEYALSFHGLIPERVETITSVTPKRDKLFQTPLGTFSYRHLARTKYCEGLDLVWMSPSRSVFMAGPEKALADYVALNVPRANAPRSAKGAKIFLEEDLRIDPELWKRFDALKLRRLNRVYKNDLIDLIVEVLEGTP